MYGLIHTDSQNKYNLSDIIIIVEVICRYQYSITRSWLATSDISQALVYGIPTAMRRKTHAKARVLYLAPQVSHLMPSLTPCPALFPAALLTFQPGLTVPIYVHTHIPVDVRRALPDTKCLGRIALRAAGAA